MKTVIKWKFRLDMITTVKSISMGPIKEMSDIKQYNFITQTHLCSCSNSHTHKRTHAPTNKEHMHTLFGTHARVTLSILD